MYKLNGHSLTRGEWYLPESQQLSWAGKDSTSTITLGPEAPEIGFGDWVMQEDGPEGQVVWRVKNIDEQKESETVSVELEHAVKGLEDQSLFSEVTTQTMAGSSSAQTVTAKKAAQYLLGLNADWTLGDFAFNDSNPYEFDGGSILDALEEIASSLEDCYLAFDMTVYPFKMHFKKRSTTVTCEMRFGRNVSTLRRSVSRSGMYTRIYPIGKNDLHIDGNYLSKNENLYGRVDSIQTDTGKTTKANLQKWAQGRLNAHCHPMVTVTVAGLELSEETGESLDHLTLNTLCRVPLPEYGTTITEPISRLQWKDYLKERQNVTVTMSNVPADVTSIIKNQSKAAGRAAKGQAKENYNFEANGEHLYYEVFSECGHFHSILNMTSESLRIGFDNLIECTRSEFLMTSESLRIAFENEISSTRSEFQMTSESLRVRFENELSSTRSEFQMTSESLRIGFENTAASLRSEIQVEAGRINLVVSGSGSQAAIRLSAIVDGINQSQLELSADRVIIGSGDNKKKVKVYVDGKISATEGDITDLKTGTTKATLINTYNLTGDTVSGGTMYAGTSMSIGTGTGGGSGNLYYRGTQYYRQGVTLGPVTNYISEGHFLGDSSTSLNLNHYHKIVATEGTGSDEGKIILTLTDPVATSDSSNHTTNFNIAATTTYQNGVLAATRSGKASVTLEDPVWTPVTGSTYPDNQEVSVSTSGRTNASGTTANLTKSAKMYLTASGLTVSLRSGSSSGTIRAQKILTDSNLKASNIKSGVSIFGVTGSYSGTHSMSWDNSGKAYGEYVGGQIWTPTSRTITCGTASQWIGIEQESAWSNGKKLVKIYKDSWNGSAMAGVEVSIGSFSYGSLSSSNSEPSSYAKMYSISSGYKYGYFNVTVANVTKRIVIKILSA